MSNTLSKFEKDLVWMSMQYAIEKPDLSLIFPYELMKYLHRHLCINDDDSFVMSNEIMSKIVRYLSSDLNISFENYSYGYPYDPFSWIDKIIKEFKIKSIEDFRFPRIFYVRRDGNLDMQKYNIHKVNDIKGFNRYLGWYNLAKVIDSRYWLDIETFDNEHILAFRTYIVNPINGLIDKVYYPLEEFIHSRVTCSSIPDLSIKDIYQYKKK